MNTTESTNNLTTEIKTDIQFHDIFDLEDVQRMQDLFSEATGVASIITDPDGIEITKTSNFCRLCQMIRATEKGLANCMKSDSLVDGNSGITKKLCQSAGLWDGGVEIHVGEKHIANWLIGQVRNEKNKLSASLAYATEIGINKNLYLEAFNEVPVMSEDRFRKILNMLSAIVNELSEKAYSNVLLKKQISERERTHESLQKSEESLSITLNSIGDGVISTDNGGRIINMNPIAEKLCGWKVTEAIGKPLTDVFNIINSKSRKVVENPVKKVLEHGKIVGLANHTVLISRDGTEYQIADSASPIRNKVGEISGVVLVFSDVTEKYQSEEDLFESERSKSVLLANLPGMAYRCKYDRSWTMEFVSEGFSVLTGYKKEDIINNQNLSFNDLILPEYQDFLWKEWERVVQNHETCQVEYRILTADHQVKWVWEQGIPIYNSAGEVEALEGLIIDITERKNMETMLQNERLLLRTLIDNIPDPIYVKDLEGNKTLANIAEVELLGAKSESEVLGKDDSYFYSEEYTRRFRENDLEAIQTGISDINREGFIIDGKGKKHWLLSSKLLLRNQDHQITGIMGISRNITERKEAEEALKKSEGFLKETQAIAQLGTYSLDITTSIWTSSEVLDSIFGIESDHEKSFDGWVSIIHPEWKIIMNEYVIDHVIGKKNKFDKKYKIIRQNDHEERWVHGFGELAYDQNQQPILLIGTIQDVTDRINAEEALRQSEEKYRNIFNNVQDVFYQVDMTGKITEISPSVKYFGEFDPLEIIGRPAQDLYSNPERRNHVLRDIIEKGELRDYEVELKTKSGLIRNISINARLVYDKDGQPSHIDGALRDITKRKITEMALYDSEKKFRDYIEFSPHGVIITDETGKYKEINSAVSKITGYSKEEILSLSPVEIISVESQGTFKNLFKRAAVEGFASGEFGFVRKEGSTGYISIDTVKLSEQLYLGFVIDITYRINSEQELKESEDFLKKTQMIANLGNCMIDFSTGSWKSSEIMDSIFGIGVQFDKTLKGIASILHPDWRKEVSEYFRFDLFHSSTKFNKKFKIIRPVDLEERWVNAIGELKFDQDNKPFQLIATVQDITERQLTTDALRLSEKLHRSILNASPNAIVVAERDGRIRVVSPAVMVLYGCDNSDLLLGHSMFEFLIPKDRDRAKTNSRLMFEGYLGTNAYQMLRFDGTPFFAEVNGDIIWSDDHQVNGMVFIIRDITDRKKSEEALKNSQLELKKFASQLQNVREEEKIQLAREIHDELGQILIAIKIDLGMTKQKVLKSIKNADSEEILTNFDNLFGLVDNTLKTTRKIMTDLRPEVLYLIGFVEAVKLYITNFKERYQLICLFENNVSGLKLSSQQSVALYRIVQESFTNIVKHSKATKVKVDLRLEGSHLVLEVIDNGIGFKTSQKNRPNSYGLLGMRERIYILDGVLQITSEQGLGTTIKVEIPYELGKD